MTKVVVMGHGGYATAVKRVLSMLVGELENFSFIDFNEEDSIDILQGRIDETLAKESDDVLFACDLNGGTPFRCAAMICLQHPLWAAAAGINISALAEVSFNTELCPRELAKLAVELTKDSVMYYPSEE